MKISPLASRYAGSDEGIAARLAAMISTRNRFRREGRDARADEEQAAIAEYRTEHGLGEATINIETGEVFEGAGRLRRYKVTL